MWTCGLGQLVDCLLFVLNAFWRRGDVDYILLTGVQHPPDVLNAFWRRGDVDRPMRA